MRSIDYFLCYICIVNLLLYISLVRDASFIVELHEVGTVFKMYAVLCYAYRFSTTQRHQLSTQRPKTKISHHKHFLNIYRSHHIACENSPSTWTYEPTTSSHHTPSPKNSRTVYSQSSTVRHVIKQEPNHRSKRTAVGDKCHHITL